MSTTIGRVAPSRPAMTSGETTGALDGAAAAFGMSAIIVNLGFRSA